jgi:hypothetical protein
MKVIEGKLNDLGDSLAKLQEDISNLIDATDGRLTVGEIVGVLEFIKFNLIYIAEKK